MQTRWKWIIIRYNPHCLDLHALRLELFVACSLRVLLAPVEGACVGMDPEETPVSRVGHFLGACFACVLVKVLADHGVGDCLDHARISCLAVMENTVVGTGARDVEAVVELRSE